MHVLLSIYYIKPGAVLGHRICSIMRRHSAELIKEDKIIMEKPGSISMRNKEIGAYLLLCGVAPSIYIPKLSAL